ncbi:MAG TPA: hypothetical protein PK307_09860 [Spirochaetota bacterium]|nr:hypothetical protein [Spirochaetota bacterium]HOD16425.1 hypothetical protein [Spirochaetota bacterium]HPG52253.1 hypothetical protein [Spirochaetota bacterium]HPN11129.1 hypothetical protein [Spirochaetota bacterium]HQL82496.1 hypothetical protein [Spirochaetota bacterium]
MKRLFLVIIIISAVCALYGEENSAPRTASIPGGYNNIGWGTRLSEARNKIRGKLVFTDDKTLILSREENMENLEYYYGFFYIDPTVESGIEGEKPAVVEPAGQEKATDGKLFYVEVKFPYLAMEDVQKKITDAYGTYTDKNLVKDQGALAWKGDSTIIIMWVDRYENKPYCRKITYIDSKITKELSDYRTRVFKNAELAILKKMSM